MKRRKPSPAGHLLATQHRPSDPEPDPLAALRETTSGDLATDCAEELDALQTGFRARTNRESDRFTRSTDGEFWFAVCFASSAERDQFIQAAQLTPDDRQYIDGDQLWKLLPSQPLP